jgi:molybdopterin/thiamine biosynthesis adenylyltransferase
MYNRPSSQHQATMNQPTKTKEPSRTAQALQLVTDGMSVRNAAAIYEITPQSIYRLMAYRKSNPACPVCGK